MIAHRSHRIVSARFSWLALSAVLACAAPAQTKPPTYAARSESADNATNAATSARPAEALRETVTRITREAETNREAYEWLTELCDDIGSRFAGTPALTRAIDWAAAKLKAAGHDNVRIDPVMVPTWVRGKESLEVLEPRARNASVLGIGGTVPTPKGGITGELFVVSSEEELEKHAAEVKGKIVLIDRPMPEYDPATNDTGYGQVFGARVFGASLAAKQGALAVLVRSLTAHSLDTPHTGALAYDKAQPKIPAACVSGEFASHLHRLFERKEKIKLHLTLESEDRPPSQSGNVLAELRGRERPDEIVLLGGHIDSWDVGQGALDDGAGVVISMEAITLLRRLGLTPRRTLRAVLFTNEEYGLSGARDYAQKHASDRHVAAIESDLGSGRVIDLRVQSEPEAQQPRTVEAMQPILELLRPLGLRSIAADHSGADIAALAGQGAVAIGLGHEASHYFDYHHTNADTLDKVNPAELAQSVATMAALAYALGELDLFGTVASAPVSESKPAAIDVQIKHDGDVVHAARASDPCPWLEYSREWKSLRLRTDHEHCDANALSSMPDVVRALLDALQKELGATFAPVSFGLSDYPEMYERIARASVSSALWDAKKGRAKTGQINPAVVAIANDAAAFYPEVVALFAPRKLKPTLSSVEKVFVGKPSETHFADKLRAAGVSETDRVPHGSIVWFHLDAP